MKHLNKNNPGPRKQSEKGAGFQRRWRHCFVLSHGGVLQIFYAVSFRAFNSRGVFDVFAIVRKNLRLCKEP